MLMGFFDVYGNDLSTAFLRGAQTVYIEVWRNGYQ